MNIFRNMLYMARRFKTATVLNFIGLTVALTAFYLLMTQVVYNHSYNHGLAGCKRLYRLETRSMWDDHEWSANINRLFADCVAGMPQVENVGLCKDKGMYGFMKNGEVMIMPWSHCTDNYLVAMGGNLVSGKLSWTEDERKGAIMPKSLAMTFFGEADVAGRMIATQNGDSVTVRGVFDDFPENSLAKNCIYFNIGKENMDAPACVSNYNYQCYVRLKQGVDTIGLDKTISNTCYQAYKQLCIDNGEGDNFERAEAEGQISIQLRLHPITETYFSNIDPANDRGNRTVDIILRLACLLFIIIAVINLLNFTLAKAPMRVKGINTRRVLGSDVTILRLSLVGEEIVFSLLAFIVAMGVAYLLSEWPLMAEMTTGSIALNDHIVLILITLIIAIVIGIVASVYPAMFVTSFQPALAIKGSFGLTPKGRKLRTSLITLQLIVSCIMVVYLGILLLQSRFIFHSDYGFEKDEVLYAEVWDIRDMNKQDALRSELLRLTGVEEVGYSQFAIGTQDSYMGWGRGDGEHQVMFTCLPCDWRYLRTLGIKIEEGRDFNEHDQDVYIINRHMKDACDWMEIDKPILKDDGTLVGVCGNVRYASVRTDRYQTNMAFHIFSDEQVKDWHPLGMVNVRVGKNIDKVQMKQQMKAVIDRLGNGSEHEVFFLDQKLEQTYEDEFRFIRQVVLFSIVCLVITLIGLFCLTLFETEYRRKEIGIRKVFGSSTGEILTMLCRSYVWLLVGSFIVAAPLAWYIGNQWLQSFAERTPIYWWLFPLALLVIALVTLLTVVIQSWRTANENPVNSIKNE